MMEPYKPRAFRLIELCQFGKWQMKLYGIAFQVEFPRLLYSPELCAPRNWATILDRCEAEAARQGFVSLELMSTLPGVEFYRACGYLVIDPIFFDAAGMALKFVPMKKALPASSAR